MPGSPTAALPQVRADRAHLDTAGAQKQDRGLRRAKAATATSIKKLFKGRRTTPEAAPCEQHRPIESRPSSVHSGRSVRSIFSSARRITLRPSMLFRHQEPEAGTASAELEHPRPDTPRPPPSPPPSPPPTAHPQRHSGWRLV
ncbi:hypothetical protein H4R19_001806 [Coemansia spiralis]|nr:hypothetical protein H4R19_001806 [Coemansia spiralis]